MLQVTVITALVLVHLAADHLRFIHVVPRSRWLSAAGGVSVAYVFVHVFPEVQEAQRHLQPGPGLLAGLEHHAWLVAMLGLVVFYGLERKVRQTQRRRGEVPGPGAGPSTTGEGVFWLHMGSFALYNGLVGYLVVHRREDTPLQLLLFGLAMAVHFLVNDYGLQQDHRDSYRRRGRWLLALAVVAGWLLGCSVEIGVAATSTLFAFLAGGVVMNVLKEELPEQRESRFLPFLGGMIGYASLLLLF